jgi:starvation-inducible DNA-binding protein
MIINTGIAEEDRRAVLAVLNKLLADEFVLYTKTRNYHWNVTGPSFYPLHKLFEEQYEALDDIIDNVAERSRAVGGKALGTLDEYVKTTRLVEEPSVYPNSSSMITNLLTDHEIIAQELRKDITTCSEHNDKGSEDFLTGLLEQHEKMSWFLRAHLEEE